MPLSKKFLFPIITGDYADKESNPQHSAKDSLDCIRIDKHDARIKMVPSNRKCKVEDCFKYAKKGGHCLKHGGTDILKRCQSEDCPKLAMKGGFCVPHGGTEYRKRCQVEECSKLAVKGGRCVSHGGTAYHKKSCQAGDCSKPPRKGGYCISPMASLVLTDSSQLTSDSFKKLPDQTTYPYAEPDDLQKHMITDDYPDKELEPQHSSKDSVGCLKPCEVRSPSYQSALRRVYELSSTGGITKQKPCPID
uniref:WRKY19-like zinc finger domain-containing protein n=1 Tax=Timema monikensis TaxID=170555 RepID=A0A7R9EFU8_9NEOP|nr:unnamed protein product [Timema monikensis]